MDFLKSAVASAISKGPPFPYTFGDKIDVDWSIWTLYNGTKREDGSNCCIFSFDATTNKARLPIARNAVRKLRTLRHPGIVKVLDTVETESYIYIATERITPLSWHVRRGSLSAETTKWGLYTIANTVRFINDEALSVHGKIKVSSVFTSESGEWKLGGLEITSSVKEDDAVIYTFACLVPDIDRYAPPEIIKGGWNLVKSNPISAVDSYGFGNLVFEVFNHGSPVGDRTGQTKNIPPKIHQSYKRLLNPNPKSRLSVSHFLEQGRRDGGFFQTPLIRLSDGVESLGLKDDGERADLLSELDQVLEDFPEEFFKLKILPELLKSVEFGGGGPKVFGFVMNIGSKLSDDEYESMVNPVILRLFASPDRQIRVCLLDNLPRMIDHFTQKTVTDKIFPQLVTGFTDLAPVVREQTVKSILTIINKLSERTINGELLKCLAKTSNDEQPGIRTNTTICLGKIARSLGANTRQRVLIAAFTRSLRDPFVHARNAALQALAATADLFPEDDCARKILPALCPSLVDKEKLVRDQANKTLDAYLTRIRKFTTTLPDTILPAPGSSNSNGPTPRMGTPQNDTSWAGWAISSFTNKLATASGDIEAKPANGHMTRPTLHHSSSSGPTLPSTGSLQPRTNSASDLHRQAVSKPPPAPVLMRTSTDNFFADAQIEAEEVEEAWGETGEDTFFDAPVTPALISSPGDFDDGGEPDFAGWLSAQAKAKSKAPLAKGRMRTEKSTERPVAPGRVAPKGSIGLPATTTRPSTAEKKIIDAKPLTINLKPKDTSPDDDWDEAWG